MLIDSQVALAGIVWRQEGGHHRPWDFGPAGCANGGEDAEPRNCDVFPGRTSTEGARDRGFTISDDRRENLR